MELDEAIAHCEEKAEEQRRWATSLENESIERGACLECAYEHEQLADWLRELKAFRKAHEMISSLPIGTGVLLAWEIMNDCLKEAKK